MTRPGTDTARYSGVAIAFHWTIAALIMANLVLGFGASYADWRVMGVHKPIGIAVLALSLARFAWRLGHRPPPLPADVTAAQRGAAHALHWTLYALMIAMPFSGWLMVSADPKYPISLFGLQIPFLPVQGNAALGDSSYTVHSWIGWAFLPLIAIHVGAALYHHFVQRDAMLLRMMPGRRTV